LKLSELGCLRFLRPVTLIFPATLDAYGV